MRRHLLATLAAALFAASLPASADAQSSPPVTAQPGQMTAYAKAWIAVNDVRDKAYAELAEPRNKKVEDQNRIRTRLKEDITAALTAQGLTQKQFDEMTQLVSADEERRKAFDAAVAELTAKKPAAAGELTP